MPVHSAASLLNHASIPTVITASTAVAGLIALKAWAGGRKCTWERDWAGKMILIVGSPTTATLTLIDHLLNLPKPPQILYLPPYASPLPESLLTILHTIRLTTTNPLAQLHCEPLPPTPRGVRDFVRKWGSTPQGTASESGRRLDAIILASRWEVSSENRSSTAPPGSSAIAESSTSANLTGSTSNPGSDPSQDPPWSTHEFHFHLLTSLLPHLLRIQADRNIRIINLVSPAWSSALPSLKGTPTVSSALQESGIRGITTLLLMQHFQLILDTLAASAYSHAEAKAREVPNPNEEEAGTGNEKSAKNRDKTIKSNVMGISVVMPWARGDVIRGAVAADTSWARWLMYIILYPLLLMVTPSPTGAIQSILFALMAPVRYGPLVDSPPRPTSMSDGQAGRDPAEKVVETADPRRSGTSGGDTVRDCQVIDLPPVLCDPAVQKAHYDMIEKAVEKGVKESATREKAYPPKREDSEQTAGGTSISPTTAAGEEQPSHEPT